MFWFFISDFTEVTFLWTKFKLGIIKNHCYISLKNAILLLIGTCKYISIKIIFNVIKNKDFSYLPIALPLQNLNPADSLGEAYYK